MITPTLSRSILPPRRRRAGLSMASSAKLRYDRRVRSGSREDRGSRAFAQGMFAQGMFAMTGPRSSGGLGFRQWTGVGGAAVLIVALLAPAPAVAQDDLFTTTVTVDATADDVAKARETTRR